MGTGNGYEQNGAKRKVSIQLMSPASGDIIEDLQQVKRFVVSIQLMSPASGDSLKIAWDASLPIHEFPFN